MYELCWAQINAKDACLKRLANCVSQWNDWYYFEVCVGRKPSKTSLWFEKKL